MKTILFRINLDKQHRIRFGETAELFRACYFRGKELGYTDGNIYMEWPKKVAFNKDYKHGVFYQCPSYTMLPIKFVCSNLYADTEFSHIINLTEPNAFYENSPPIYTKLEDKNDYSGQWNFFNKYYLEKKRRPVFKLKKGILSKPYILFHIRVAEWNEERNPNLETYEKLIKLFKERYGDKYLFGKCGEKCYLDDKFDYVSPIFKELNFFLSLVNDASLFICTDSGPNAFGYGLGIPLLEIEASKTTKLGPDFLSEECWKLYGGKWGKTSMDWVDKKKFKVCYKGDELNLKDVVNYSDTWLNG